MPAAFFGVSAVLKFGGALGISERDALATASPDIVSHYALIGHHTLAGIFYGIMAILFLVRKQPIRKLGRWVPQIAAVAGTFSLATLSFHQVTLDYWWVTIAASLILTFGLACSVVSVLVLGRCFGILPEARGLITWGPYRYVRHPLYTSEVLAFLGLLLPVISPASLAIYGVFVLLQGLRSKYEEEVLVEAFPEYADYQQRTWRFLPGIW